MKPRRALTVIELLVALALGGALLAAVFMLLSDLVQTRARARAMAQRDGSIAALFDRLQADLEMAIVGDAVLGPGVSGDASTIRVLTRGVLLGDEDLESGFADLHRQEYRFDPVTRTLSGRRDRARGGGNERFLPFDAELAHVRFRYHDGAGWNDAYDSLTAGALPVAVEVAVWLAPPKDAEAEESGDGFVEEAGAPRPSDAAEGRGARGATAPDAAIEEADVAQRPPDRRRLIFIPDAPGIDERAAPAAPTTPDASDVQPEDPVDGALESDAARRGAIDQDVVARAAHRASAAFLPRSFHRGRQT